MRAFLFIFCLIACTSCASSRYQGDTCETAPPPLAKAQPKPLIVVIDPGHGGKDEGAQAKKPAYQEKELALKTSLYLKKYLEGMGYQTIITRADDTFVPLKVRSCFANSNNCDLFVSVHYNSAKNKTAQGIEVFYYKSTDDPVRSTQSKVLADVVLKKVLSQTGAKSRGVKHGNLSVIRETTMPAILVEGGFLTNAEECQKILNGDYSQRLAWGIATGVRDYLNQRG